MDSAVSSAVVIVRGAAGLSNAGVLIGSPGLLMIAVVLAQRYVHHQGFVSCPLYPARMALFPDYAQMRRDGIVGLMDRSSRIAGIARAIMVFIACLMGDHAQERHHVQPLAWLLRVEHAGLTWQERRGMGMHARMVRSWVILTAVRKARFGQELDASMHQISP